ncbi:MAG TPA: DUF3313 family protein [Pseudomonadales bacterium]|nr:DUF3313 family protein [Pseudomonadales bacterium]
MRNPLRMLLLVVLGVGVLAACAAKVPTLSTDASRRTHDGLYPIDNASFDSVWARADLDLAPYDRIMLEGVGIQYRPVAGGAARGSRTAFPLDAAQKQRLAEEMSSAFATEFGKSQRFAITDTAGPDVLLIRGGLLDVVSSVPPQTAGRVDIYLESVGSATLVLEIVDAQSGTVLVRALDRRAAERRGLPMRSSPVTNWSEVRQLAHFWARTLRERLDELDERLTLD